MKQILSFLFITVLCTFGFSQAEYLTNGDFSDASGAPWAFTGGGAVVGGEAAFATTNSAGNPWDTQLVHGGLSFVAGDEFTLTFDARADAARTIEVAIQNVGGGWEDQFRQTGIALTTTMQSFSYTFNAAFTNTNVQLGFLLAGSGSSDGVYIDNVSLMGPVVTPPPATGPTSIPSTPPARNAWDVASVVSNGYADVAVSTWGPDWGPTSARITDATADSGAATDNVKELEITAGKSFAGIVLANPIDATNFTNFHIEYYIAGSIPAGLEINPKLSNHAAGAGETSAIGITITPTATDTWVISDNLLSDFFSQHSSGLLDRDAIKEIVITAARADTATPVELYIDNLYFYRAATASVNDVNASRVAIELYPNPAVNQLNIKTKSEVQSVKVYNSLGQQVLQAKGAQVDVSKLASGVYMVEVETENQVAFKKFVKK